MANLRVLEITKTFGKRRVLDRVSLEVRPGERLVLVGPSGSGKTTLLRVIAGLEQPDAGGIEFAGRSLLDLPPFERQVGMVFQHDALWPNLTVRQHLEFGEKARRSTLAAWFHRMRLSKERQRRQNGETDFAAAMQDVVERLGLAGLLDRRVAGLSGGERQRVAIARAMVRRPRLLLLDEPIAHLDAPTRCEFRLEIKNLHAWFQAPMIYVTHDQQEALALGDRVAVLHEGRVLQVGTPREIYQHPCDTFVAAFVGNPGMSLLEEQPGKLLGVRAECVSLSPIAGDVLTIAGAIIASEYRGDSTLLYLETPAGRLAVRTANDAPQIGEKVRVWIRNQDLVEIRKAATVANSREARSPA